MKNQHPARIVLGFFLKKKKVAETSLEVLQIALCTSILWGFFVSEI